MVRRNPIPVPTRRRPVNYPGLLCHFREFLAARRARGKVDLPLDKSVPKPRVRDVARGAGGGEANGK